jgi:hypothetical protein
MYNSENKIKKIHQFLFSIKKKMKIVYLFVTVLLITDNPIFCFINPNDFCKKTELKKSCMAFDCGTKYCVYDRSSCVSLIQWEILMKKYATESIVKRNFLSKIKNCEQSDYKNQWSHRFNFG